MFNRALPIRGSARSMPVLRPAPAGAMNASPMARQNANANSAVAQPEAMLANGGMVSSSTQMPGFRAPNECLYQNGPTRSLQDYKK